MKISRMSTGVALSAALVLGMTACAANEGGAQDPEGGESQGAALEGTLTGIGASSMATAQETWVAEFQTANSGVTVNYSPDGSGAGREAFAGGGADFAGSDRALEVEEVADLASSRCAPDTKAIDLPVYISPIAIIFNIEGVEDLKLDAETLAGIFKGDIKKWNDEKIASQNEGTDLPDQAITAVHRADDSGTTENLTDYLNVAAPDVWDSEADGVWPYETGEAAPQTSGMVDAVSNGSGTIGYADASRAGDLGVAQIKVGEEYIEYTPEAAAAIVDASPRAEDAERSEHDIAVELDRKAEGNVYPIVLVSYAIACEQYQDAATAEKVKAYLGYIASAEGQQAAADSAGIAPLSEQLSTDVAASIEAIS